MSMVGANPEELDALGHQMSVAAERLEAIRGELTSSLSVTSWRGPDAEMFQGEWSSHLSGNLLTATQGIASASRKLHFEASQQRQASDVRGIGTSIPDSVGSILGGANTMLGLAQLPFAVRSLYRFATLPGDVASSIVSKVLSGSSELSSTFERNAEIASDVYRTAAVSDVAEGGMAAFHFGGRLATGIGVLGIASDAWTVFHPDFSGVAGNVERGAALVNAGGLVVTLLGFDGSVSWIPVAGEVAVVGTGVYLAGAWLYKNVPAFKNAVNDVGSGVASAAEDVVRAGQAEVDESAAVLSGGIHNVEAAGQAVSSDIGHAAGAVAKLFGL